MGLGIRHSFSVGAILAFALGVCFGLAPAALAAPTWLAPTELPSGRQTGDASVALDAAGDAVAWWTERDADDQYAVQVAERSTGGAWGASPAPFPPGAADPRIALDPAGDAVAVWVGARGSIDSRSRPAGGEWGATRNVGSDHFISEFKLEIDRTGGAVLLWEGIETYYGPEDDEAEVHAAILSPDGVWSGPVDLSPLGVPTTDARLAVGDDGEVIAAWVSDHDTGGHIEATDRPTDGQWSRPARLSEGSGDDYPPVQLAAALGSSGRGFVAWVDEAGEVERPDRIKAATVSRGGDWGSATTVAGPGTKLQDPTAAVEASGGAVLAWVSEGEGPAAIETATAAPDDGWTQPATIATPGGHLGSLGLKIDPAGDALLGWWRFVGSGPESSVQTVDRPEGEAWGPVQNVATGDGIPQEPRFAIDPDGDAVAIWHRFRASVQAAGFDAAGPRLRDLTVPGLGVVGSPLSFSVAPLDTWSGVASTTWNFGDGHRTGETSASHAYAKPGAYEVRVTSTDAVGNTSTASRMVSIKSTPIRSTPTEISGHRFGLGPIRRRPVAGLARIAVDVSTAGLLRLTGAGVRSAERSVSRQERVWLPLIPRGAFARRLHRHGRRFTAIEVRLLAADTGAEASVHRRVRLVARRDRTGRVTPSRP